MAASADKLILAGLQQTSLIDFPGRVSCVAFVTGCNFTCPYCHNPRLARGEYPRRMTVDDLLDFIRPRRHLLDGVTVSGGEPTLHPGLPDLCRRLRQAGQAVKLDTNGSRPAMLQHLIREGLVDFVALDIKTEPARYGPPLADVVDGPAVAESIRILMASSMDYEFRTTCVRPFVDAATVTAIAEIIRGARCYTLQPFRAAELLRPDFFGSADCGFNPMEMAGFQKLAAPYVQRCQVR